MSSKQDKKKHSSKTKKSEKMSHSKAHKKKKKKHKSSVSPARVALPDIPRSPTPPPSSAKKSRISTNMNDTSLFAKLVKAKKKEIDEDINESTKVDNSDKCDDKSISNQDADTSELFVSLAK